MIDLCWKIAHGVLFTADRLIGFGYSIDPSCFCGLASECLPHLFFSCPLAQSALSWLQSLMFRFSSLSPSFVCRHVLFGFSPDEVPSFPRIFVYMLNVCKFSIWKVRNDFHFRDVPPGAFVVIEMVKSRVRFFLPLLFTVKILSAFRLLLKNRFHYSETNRNLRFKFRSLNGILISCDRSLSPTSFELLDIDWFIVVTGEVWRHLLFHIARDYTCRILR